MNIQDMTARNHILPAGEPGMHQQRGRAKGFDGSSPCGPWLLTADEVAGLQNLRVRMWVDDELRQDGNTRDMVVDIAWPTAPDDLMPTFERGFGLKLRTGGAVAAAFSSEGALARHHACHLGAHPVSKVQPSCAMPCGTGIVRHVQYRRTDRRPGRPSAWCALPEERARPLRRRAL